MRSSSTDAVADHRPSAKAAEEAGSYLLGSSTFSVYEEMARQLRERGWRRKTDASIATVDLILGDRFHIPYSLLRGEPMAPSSWFGGTRWVNYFEGSHRLTLKAEMVRLMKTVDLQWATWLPESYAIGGDRHKREDERQTLLEAVAAQAPETVWIVKPSSGAKGRRIELLYAATVPEWLERLPDSSRTMWVVQRYVDRPFLLSHRRKFDMRVWALLMSPYSIYAYTEASCRIASVPYDIADITNTHAHITNHCLQEGAEDFGKYEEGNEMWLPQLQAYLTSLGRPSDMLEARVLPAIKELIVRSLLAIMPIIAVPATETYRCFQLFGYDIILTEEAEVRLLEINGSPGIAERFLPPLVRDMSVLLGVMHPASSEAADVALTATADNVNGERERGSLDDRRNSCGAGWGPTDAASLVISKAAVAAGLSPPACAAPVTTREWRLGKEGFVLLWQLGETVPPGLIGLR